MGFKIEKQRVLDCLKNGSYEHDMERSNIDTKNLFKIGLITPEQVHAAISRARGTHYRTAPHHLGIKGVHVHIIDYYDKVNSCNWYIKWYYIEPDTFFISVHH